MDNSSNENEEVCVYLEFDQHSGFTEAEKPEWLSYIEDDDRCQDWDYCLFTRLGYEEVAWFAEGANPDITIHVYRMKKKKEVFPLYVLTISDVLAGEYVFVKDSGSAMALRLKLAALISVNIADYLQDLREIAIKTFRTDHGHRWNNPCIQCDPDAVRHIRDQKLRMTKGTPAVRKEPLPSE